MSQNMSCPIRIYFDHLKFVCYIEFKITYRQVILDLRLKNYPHYIYFETITNEHNIINDRMTGSVAR